MFGLFKSPEKREMLLNAYTRQKTFKAGLDKMRFIANDKNVKVVMDGNYTVLAVELINHASIDSEKLSRQIRDTIKKAHACAEKSVKRYTKSSGMAAFIASTIASSATPQ